MKTRCLAIFLAVSLVATAGIARAGGMHWSGASGHSAGEKAAVSSPILVSTEYLEYLEIEKGLETGSLTAPGVQPTTSLRAVPAEGATGRPPAMATNDFLEYLEIERGIETGSLTAPGVHPTEISGPSGKVEIPEGG